MRLLHCRLRQVRQHRDLGLRFGRRFTLIGGANETGKSTLVEALHKGLFLRATATGRGVEELRSRLHPGLPEVEIGFEACGQAWQLRKRFAGASGTCQLSNGAGVALSGAAAEEQLAALLGVEGPVAGTQIRQLPERWAHLWVRQGEAASNPLQAKQESYDFSRLVDQLQQRGSSGALESPLDRRVLELLQERVAEFFTGTGKVRAGSRLAEVQRREAEAATQLGLARERLSELEAAMEQLRAIQERLSAIEGQERPALLARQRQEAERLRQLEQLEQRRRLTIAERDPLAEALERLRRQQRQRQELLTQQAQQLEDQARQAAEVQRLEAELAASRAACERGGQLRLRLEGQRQRLLERQELLQLRLDQLQLEAEESQLREHQEQLGRLQREAEGLKQRLAALPAIGTEQVRELRRAEGALAEARARCQAMAASLELLSADLPVHLDGLALEIGQPQLLSGSSELQVGAGVRLRLSPGGGEALPQARTELERSQAALTGLQEGLGVADSEMAEAIERQRRALESDLTNLRKAASAIPWAGLQERVTALEPRRLRLELALAALDPIRQDLAADPETPALDGLDRNGLEEELQRLRQTTTLLVRQLEQTTQQLQQAEERERELGRELVASRGRLEQLAGSLGALAERLAAAEGEAGGDDAATTLAELEGQWRERQAQIASLEAALAALGPATAEPGAADPAPGLGAAVERLEQERESLLTQLGQAEQRCAGLGAENPVAELERRQAEWEASRAERDAIESQGQALQLLQARFHAAQTDLANRYSEPLGAAIAPYLAALGRDPRAPLLRFDPERGFQDLQLRQGSEAYDFEKLSGGMREQLAGALRLALAEVLQPAYDGCLPLVFDDAFTNSDPQRLPGLRRMLRLAIEHGVQVVLLSCDPAAYGENALMVADPDWDEREEAIQLIRLG
ncbi:hypothetical protein [Vulcanococcus limneticus]|uniref:hypothetical protein n=1 Tax=Vulcanococcus limneticus TaxID=2170428 RepID=UPI00398C1DFD